MSHDDNEQPYDFAPAELERTEAEMAAREARAKTEGMLAWAKTRSADRSAAAPRPAPSKANRGSDEVIRALGIKLGQLRHEMKAADRRTIEACMAAVGGALIAERARARAELETEVLKLRAEFLQAELDRDRGVRRIKAVPPSLIA
jgi:hypothetical protein